MTPQPGDFQLVPMGGEGGRIIRVLQALNGTGFSDYEHARLYLGNGDFLEAQPGGAVIARHPLNEGLWSSGLIAVPDRVRGAIVTAGRYYGPREGHPGVGYSYLDYGALVLHRLHIPAPRLRAFIAATGHQICSQLVDQCYSDAGVHLFSDGRWAGDVTPGDLYQLLKGKS